MGEAARRAAWAHLSRGSPPWQAGNPATLLAQRDTARRGGRSTSCARALSLSLRVCTSDLPRKQARATTADTVGTSLGEYIRLRTQVVGMWFFLLFPFERGKHLPSAIKALAEERSCSSASPSLALAQRSFERLAMRPLSSSHTTKEALLVVLPLTLSSSHTTREALLVVLPLTVRAMPIPCMCTQSRLNLHALVEQRQPPLMAGNQLADDIDRNIRRNLKVFSVPLYNHINDPHDKHSTRPTLATRNGLAQNSSSGFWRQAIQHEGSISRTPPPPPPEAGAFGTSLAPAAAAAEPPQPPACGGVLPPGWYMVPTGTQWPTHTWAYVPFYFAAPQPQ